MQLITNAVYWFMCACVVVGFGSLAFSWERMRQELNQVLPSEQKIAWYPPLPQSFGQLVWRTNELGYVLNVLDQYRKFHPLSSLPKKVAFGLVIWILCFMAMLARGVGH
jgi:hypothetical protein